MTLSEFSIRRPVFAWMLMVAIILFGVLSFRKLGMSQLPDVDFPVVSVSLSLPGAAPEVMEGQVIDVVEDAIMEIDGIRNLTSNAMMGSGNISIEFELSRNIDEAVQEVQDRVSQVRNMLPINLMAPSVKKSNPEDQPIMWLALSNDGSVSLMDTMIYARNYLYNQFATVPGVGDISLGGYVDPALRVWLDINKMKKLDITSDDVLTAIQADHVEVPAGRLENSSKEYNVRIMGEANNPLDFGKMVVNSRSGLGPNFRPTQLNQIATIEESTADIRKISRFNGRMAVGLGIQKQHGANGVEIADGIRKKLAEIMPTLPPQFQISVRNDTTRFIRQSVSHLNFMLLLSALLTSIVCYLFLGSWTSTINVLMAIPTSIIGTFAAFLFFGFTLNTFTLLGLSLAIGIVVDDAIMMLENISRHLSLGKKRKEAAIEGSKEITFAAIAATVAVIAIFLPVVFMKGVIGRYFFQFGVTVSIAVLLSLVEALTLTPMRCSRYLKVETHAGGMAGFVEKVFEKLSARYQRVLAVFLNYRWTTLFVTLAFCAGSFYVCKTLNSELIPQQDQAQLMLRIKTKVGSSIEFTDSKFKEVEAFLKTIPEVEGAFTMVGGFGADSANQGAIFVSLYDASKRKKSQADLIKELRPELKKRIKGAQINIQDLSLRGFSPGRGFPVEFIIQGPDWEVLTTQANRMIEEMKKLDTFADVNTDIQPGMPEVHIIPNRKKMSEHGVSLTTVTSVINTLFGGTLMNGQTEYPKAGHRYEIEVRLIASQRDKIPELSQIKVRNNRGEVVQLSELVDIETKPSLLQISRLNRQRAITVYANPGPGHSQQEALAVAEKIGKSLLPQGYLFKLSGNSQSFKESFQSLIFALILGLIVSYMVLASQFNSFLHPLAVLMALPFSFSGAFIGLAIFHQSINLYSMIGLILLMGIVKKNSILLVDFTNQKRSEGKRVREALLEACPVRLRPILMTSVATIAGALPEAFSIGPGAETTVPMAIAIIGGVIASTILTLFVVPCAYSLLWTAKIRARWFFGAFK